MSRWFGPIRSCGDSRVPWSAARSPRVLLKSSLWHPWVPNGSFDQPLEMGGDVVACEPTKPSEWVLGKYHEFGEYIGASYEGYEEEVLNLLRSIDARRPTQPRNKDCTIEGRESQGGRGSRELKGLLSSINYDNGSARRRMDPRERVLSITQ
jgi:hypothetical protein